MAKLFFSYSHKDEALRDELEVHLAMLKRQGRIESWHDRKILAGDAVDGTIDAHLQSSDVILMLVSPDFLASPYCYDIEVQRAMARHEAGDARVIAVILRACDWQATPFAKLLVTPKDGRPITKWPDRDEAFLDVTKQISAALPATHSSTSTSAPQRPRPSAPPEPVMAAPRSSNLRVAKKFTDAERDRFMEEAFEYIARYFDGSLAELEERNANIETSYKRIDGHTFRATIYRGGGKVSECFIQYGGDGAGFGSGISYSLQQSLGSGRSFNELLQLDESNQSLGLKPLGMGASLASYATGNRRPHLTHEGAASVYWDRLMEPVQRK